MATTRPDQTSEAQPLEAMTFISLSTSSRRPKYAQIVDGVTGAIQAGLLRKGDPLPSIGELCGEFALSRETAVKAYDVLKRRGIVEARLRKGYFVRTESFDHTLRVFLLFDELSPYKQVLYNAFLREIGPAASVDIYFHHYNIKLYEKLARDSAGNYDRYVLMPYKDNRIPDIAAVLPPANVLMLDRCECVGDQYPRITQHIEGAVYDGLLTGIERFRAYKEVALIFPKPSNHPEVIITDFRRFCAAARIKGREIHQYEGIHLKRGVAYIVLEDDHLVSIVDDARKKGLTLGEDIGVVSYNETNMKHVIASGITVISTDFNELGRRAAQYVLEPDDRREVIPTRIIMRNSL